MKFLPLSIGCLLLVGCATAIPRTVVRVEIDTGKMRDVVTCRALRYAVDASGFTLKAKASGVYHSWPSGGSGTVDGIHLDVDDEMEIVWDDPECVGKEVRKERIIESPIMLAEDFEFRYEHDKEFRDSIISHEYFTKYEYR